MKTTSSSGFKGLAKSRLLWSALRLDVVDLAYLPGHAPLSSRYWVEHRNAGKPQDWRHDWFIARVAALVRNSLRPGRLHHGNPIIEPGSLLVVTGTQNNRDALRPVEDELQSRTVSITHWTENEWRQFDRQAYRSGLAFLPALLVRWLLARGYVRKSFRWAGDVYGYLYGFYLAVRQALRESRPSGVLVSNDHIGWFRAIVQAANDEHVPTFYVQHASVTEEFPPLNFDTAFLEGRDALEKYEVAARRQASRAPTTDVFLVGMTKFDSHSQRPHGRTSVRRIGLAANLLDDFDRIADLAEAIRAADRHLELALRPHPRASNADIAKFEQLAQDQNLRLSDARREPPVEFVASLDAVIACDSSILLEAALLNVLPMYYPFSPDSNDYYGYCRSGLCERFDNTDSVIAELKRLESGRADVRAAARHYVATAGSAWEGRSSQLIAEVIERRIIEADLPDLWVRIDQDAHHRVWALKES